MKFNINGKYFAYYDNCKHHLRIYDIGTDITTLKSKIETEDHFFDFKWPKINDTDYDEKTAIDYDFTNVKTFKFDLEDRFICMNNNKEIIVINLKTKKHFIHKIDQHFYDAISGMKLKSSDEEHYQLFVITNFKNERKVDFYDIALENESTKPKKQSLNYFNNKTKYFQCKISNNL